MKPKIFMISDMHFSDTNIIKYANRPFPNSHVMNKHIIRNWNNTVQPNDEVFCLGDISSRDRDNLPYIIQQLNGIKTLILGNHDRDESPEYWKDVGFNVVSKYPIIIDEFFILSHEPMYLTESMPYANIHGHIHHLRYDSNQYFNVSVECINYIPMDFEDIKKIIIIRNKKK